MALADSRVLIGLRGVTACLHLCGRQVRLGACKWIKCAVCAPGAQRDERCLLTGTLKVLCTGLASRARRHNGHPGGWRRPWPVVRARAPTSPESELGEPWTSLASPGRAPGTSTRRRRARRSRKRTHCGRRASRQAGAPGRRFPRARPTLSVGMREMVRAQVGGDNRAWCALPPARHTLL